MVLKITGSDESVVKLSEKLREEHKTEKMTLPAETAILGLDMRQVGMQSERDSTTREQEREGFGGFENTVDTKATSPWKGKLMVERGNSWRISRQGDDTKVVDPYGEKVPLEGYR